MLIGPHTTACLPQGDLAYAAFRLALQDTFCNLEMQQQGDTDEPFGFLSEVAFLQQVALPVQVDLLAATWTRHILPDPVEASLLDAAVVHAAFRSAGGLIKAIPDLAHTWLVDGPCAISPALLHQADQQLEEMFEDWWDDVDFLLVDGALDLPPDEAEDLKSMLGLPDAALQPLFDVLGRWSVPETLGQNLAGLLTPGEIDEVLTLLSPHTRFA